MRGLLGVGMEGCIAARRRRPRPASRVASTCPIVRRWSAGSARVPARPGMLSDRPAARPSRSAAPLGTRADAPRIAQPSRRGEASHGDRGHRSGDAAGARRCCGAAPRWACTTTRRPPRAGRAARASSSSHANGTAGADRHAGRARRHRRPGHAGLAVPRRPRVVRRHRIAMTRGRRKASSSTRSRCAASSRSDTRGMLGMADARRRAGARRPAATCSSSVRIAAPGVAPERLRALVEDGCRCSPIPNAVRARDAGRRCTSTSTPADRDGRAVRDAARRAPGRRDLHPGAASPRPGATSRRAPTRPRRSSSPAPSAS